MVRSPGLPTKRSTSCALYRSANISVVEFLKKTTQCRLFSAGCMISCDKTPSAIFYKCLRNGNGPRTSIVLRMCSSHGIISLQMHRWWHSSLWRKGVTAFFLLWTLADLSVPGLCQSDDDGSRDTQVLSQVDSASQVRPSGTQLRMASNSGQKSAPSTPEDCFCCCAHIVATPHFCVASIQRSAFAEALYDFNQVAVPTLPLYHPPRS